MGSSSEKLQRSMRLMVTDNESIKRRVPPPPNHNPYTLRPTPSIMDEASLDSTKHSSADCRCLTHQSPLSHSPTLARHPMLVRAELRLPLNIIWLPSSLFPHIQIADVEKKIQRRRDQIAALEKKGIDDFGTCEDNLALLQDVYADHSIRIPRGGQ